MMTASHQREPDSRPAHRRACLLWMTLDTRLAAARQGNAGASDWQYFADVLKTPPRLAFAQQPDH
jgi:hypothetical protein